MANITENDIASIMKTLLDEMEGFLASKPNGTVNIRAATSVYEDLQRLKLWNAYLLRKDSLAFETIKLKDESLYFTISDHLYNALSALYSLKSLRRHGMESETSDEIEAACEHLECSVDLLIDLTESIATSLHSKTASTLHVDQAHVERAAMMVEYIEKFDSQLRSRENTPDMKAADADALILLEDSVSDSGKLGEKGWQEESWVQRLNKDEPAMIILLVGRTGAGKSSLVKSITGRAGLSINILECPPGCKIVRVPIEGRDYFFIDSPGFYDDDSLWGLFTTIMDIINPVRNHIIFAGVWCVVNHLEERSSAIDAKLLDWLSAFCGNDFFPYLTFVTTHWDCVNNRGYHKLEERLRTRKQQWKHFLNGGAKTYQHGKIYEDDGTERNETLDYRLDDERLSLQARKMVSRSCKQLPASIPRLLQELIECTSLENITAASVLRPIMSVHSANLFCSDSRLETQPYQDQRSTHSLAEETFQGQGSNAGQELNQTTPTSVDEDANINENLGMFSTVREAISRISNEIISGAVKLRSEAGLSASERLNPQSSIDVMRAHGQSYTLEARSQLADDWDIHAGPNGSQVQNDALRREAWRRLNANNDI